MLTREFTASELSSSAAFRAFVADLGGVKDGRVVCLKGFGSGMEASTCAHYQKFSESITLTHSMPIILTQRCKYT